MTVRGPVAGLNPVRQAISAQETINESDLQALEAARSALRALPTNDHAPSEVPDAPALFERFVSIAHGGDVPTALSPAVKDALLGAANTTISAVKVLLATQQAGTAAALSTGPTDRIENLKLDGFVRAGVTPIFLTDLDDTAWKADILTDFARSMVDEKLVKREAYENLVSASDRALSKHGELLKSILTERGLLSPGADDDTARTALRGLLVEDISQVLKETLVSAKPKPDGLFIFLFSGALTTGHTAEQLASYGDRLMVEGRLTDRGRPAAGFEQQIYPELREKFALLAAGTEGRPPVAGWAVTAGAEFLGRAAAPFLGIPSENVRGAELGFDSKGRSTGRWATDVYSRKDQVALDILGDSKLPVAVYGNSFGSDIKMQRVMALVDALIDGDGSPQSVLRPEMRATPTRDFAATAQEAADLMVNGDAGALTRFLDGRLEIHNRPLTRDEMGLTTERWTTVQGPRDTRIADIQGPGLVTGMDGKRVAVEAVVTNVKRDGFVIQDPDDTDPKRSSAIFVYARPVPRAITENAKVRVEGVIKAFARSPGDLPKVQLTGDLRIQVASTVGETPEPLPLGIGDNRWPAASTRWETALEKFYRPRDNMLVGVNEPMVVVGPSDRFGNAVVVPERLARRRLDPLGTLRLGETPFPARFKLNLPTEIYRGLTVGSRIEPGVVGTLAAFDFGQPALQPTSQVKFEAANLIRERSPLKGSATEMAFASINVQNLDPVVEDPMLSGGSVDDDVGDGKFSGIARQVALLNSPDAIGLQELQDNSGTQRDGVRDASLTARLLEDALKTETGCSYKIVWKDPPSDAGGQPGGNIRNAIAYRTDRVELVPDTLRSFGTEDSRFEGTRNPLLATLKFKPTGKTVEFAVKHASSKFGSTPTIRDPRFQEVVAGEKERAQEQAALDEYSQSRLADDPKHRYIELGDWNAPPSELPTPKHLFGLEELLPEEKRFSLIFQGNAELIDRAAVSPALKKGAKIWMAHYNSPFPANERPTDHDLVHGVVSMS
ncbi:MAG: endonuclease/exonuclease/phosphatase family protein [Myxococcota bacterium]